MSKLRAKGMTETITVFSVVKVNRSIYFLTNPDEIPKKNAKKAY
jgi:hypothetical protein